MPAGGPQPGSGRPKGSLSPKTLQRERTLAELRKMIAAKADVLFRAQMAVACGLSFLFRIDVDEEGKRKKAEHVTCESEIKEYFELHHGEPGEMGKAFYYVTTIKPDNQAIDSLLNRTFGRPKETVELSGPDGAPIQTIVMDRLLSARRRTDDPTQP